MQMRRDVAGSGEAGTGRQGQAGRGRRAGTGKQGQAGRGMVYFGKRDGLGA
jgi:hypothetical protein